MNFDVAIVGSGLAGLSVALHLADRRKVVVISKRALRDGASDWAQGGIAAVLDSADSHEQHVADTLVAGAGLCDETATRYIVSHGREAIEWLISQGVPFTRDEQAELGFHLTREGGHLRDRIAHAGGDATGAEVSRALVAAVALDPGIELIEGALVLDLLVADDGSAQGVTLHVMGQGQRDGVGAALAPAVILATGGIGQVFAQTTNPAVSTGDGIALALRAGAEVADLEFVQFHPTVMWLGPNARGQQPLVSEAVRGEGALLRDDEGNRFMLGEHPLAELAPRDVVSRAIMRTMMQTGAPHVWLDARMFGEKLWRERFPTILASCREHDIDPVTELIPVAPASHYASGGVLTDLDGRASIEGLFACGEAACTGVHGANRLASNSLLEGLVFAERIGRTLAGESARRKPGSVSGHVESLVPNSARRELQQVMSADVSVIRSATSLARAAQGLRDITERSGAMPCTEDWETTNLHEVARVLVDHARIRTETRGSHWREDFPERDDERWRVRLVSHLSPEGDITTRHASVTDSAEVTS